MAYTSAQLVAAYTAANGGVAPDAATTALLGAFATQTQTGQLSDTAALAYVLNSADNDVNVAVQTYQFFTGKTPTKDGLAYLVNSTTNANDLNDPYYAQFGLENRYINFAANLGVVGEGKDNFATTYGSLSYAQFVGILYETIIGSSYAQAAGINVSAAIADIASRQANFTAIARQAGLITATSTAAQIDIATKAATVGYLMAEGIKADVGIYAAGANNFVNSLVQQALGTSNAAAPQYNVNLITSYSGLGGGTGQAGGNQGPVGGTVVSALTTGVDTVSTGPGNDRIDASRAITVAGQLDTLNNADVINGGAGVDTLFFQATLNGGGAATVVAPTVTGVEVLEVEVQNAFGTTVNLSTGDGSLNTVTSSNSAGALTVTNVQSAVGTVNLTNTAAGVRVDSLASALTGTSDAVTVNLNNATGAAGVNLRGAWETVNVNSNGSIANSITLDTDATAGASAGAAATVNVAKNTAALTLAINDRSVTTVDASATVGVGTGSPGVTLTLAAGGTANVTVKGGAGADVVDYNGTYNSSDIIDLGGGNDRLVLTNAEAIAATTVQTNVTGVEVIGLSNGANGTISLVNFGATGLRLATSVDATAAGGDGDSADAGDTPGVAGALTVNYSAGPGTLDLRNSGLGANALVANSAGAATTDTLAITVGVATPAAQVIAAQAGGTLGSVSTTGGTVTLNGFETVTLTSNAGTNTFGDAIVLTNTAANETLNTAGAQGLIFNGAITADTINASAMTGSAFIQLNAGVNAASGAAITGSLGADVLFASANNDIVGGGAGNDRINGEAGADSLTGGTDNDTFRFDSTAETQGTGYAATDTSILNIDRITDFNGNGNAAGDTIELATTANAFGAALQFTTTSTVNVTAITLATAADFAAIATGIGGAATASVTGAGGLVQVWDVTVTGGNLAGRYLVINDDTAGINLAAGNDTVIGLTGITGALNAQDFVFAA